MAARNASAIQFTSPSIDHEFWKDFSEEECTWLYTPLTSLGLDHEFWNDFSEEDCTWLSGPLDFPAPADTSINHAFWKDYSEEEQTWLRQQRLHAVAVRVGRLNEDEQSTARSPRASLGFSPLRPTKPVSQPRSNTPVSQPRSNMPVSQPRSNTPVSQPRSNTPTPTHVMGARAAVTTAVLKRAGVSNADVKTASVRSVAVKSVPVKAAVSAAKAIRVSAAAPAKAAAARSIPAKPAAAAAKGAPAKATRVTPAAASSVAAKSSPAGSVATKAAGLKTREQGNRRAEHMAVRAVAGKAALGRVEAAGGRAAGSGESSGRSDGGATLIPQPGQSRAAHTAAAAKAVHAAPHSTRKPAAPAAAVPATRIPKPRTAALLGSSARVLWERWQERWRHVVSRKVVCAVGRLVAEDGDGSAAIESMCRPMPIVHHLPSQIPIASPLSFSHCPFSTATSLFAICPIDPEYDDWQGYGGGRAHGDEPEYGDEQERDDEPEYGGEQEHGDEPEYGGEREHGDEQEDGDPQQEGNDLAPVGPHVPSGAVEGEHAPSAEHADTAAAAEEEEGEAREEGARAADSERLERRYAPDALQQEVRIREGGARTMQSRGTRGRSGAEDRRTTGTPRRRAETRDGSSRSPREPPPRADRYGGAAGKRGGGRRMWFTRRRHRGHLEEAVGESIARQRHSGTGRGDGKKDHAHRTSGSSGGQGTEGCRGRPTSVVGEKEGGRKQTARSQAHGSRARAGRNGRQPQRDVSRVKPATGNGSRVIIRLRDDGNGRGGKRVSGASQGRRAESSWRAGPRQAAWARG
ncbi:unnamed protein product [Closterium sp. Naga37s-1]|nr:unnamed protein product [Closterium sp. Naga37s-1]